MDLKEKQCTPCTDKTRLLSNEARIELLEELADWHINSKGFLERRFIFQNFARSLTFANKIGDIANNENHHPDLLVRWGELVVTIWTHAVGGLTENDFILAAKISEMAATQYVD